MCLTMWRIAMDEIEFKKVYNEAVNCADAEPRKAMLLMLQLINALREQVEELQMTEDGC